MLIYFKAALLILNDWFSKFTISTLRDSLKHSIHKAAADMYVNNLLSIRTLGAVQTQVS